MGQQFCRPKGHLSELQTKMDLYDVNLGNGALRLSRNHPGSIWFDAWDVALMRAAKAEVLFAHKTHKPI
jgi:hypothetical protein